METPGGGDYRIEPEFLGPLGDRPLAEIARKSSPDDLFPGASKFLSARVQRKRREQWNAVRPLVKRLLQPGEHVLHVAYAQQVPPFLNCVGLGHMVYAYHQVLLVITDQRIIEALLSVRGTAAGTRLRAWSYRHLGGLKQRLGKLTAIAAKGGRQAWRVRARGDRKLVGLLLPRLQPRLLAEGAAHAEPMPQWHCPRCGAAVPPAPERCAGCRTAFRSTRVAALLSLAFPGGGLFYLGHPFLGALSLFGEVMIFIVWIAMMLGAGEKDGLAPALVGGALLFAMIKLQGLNVARVLGSRSIPEPEGRRGKAGRLAIAGGAVSLLLVAGAFPLAAAARPRVDHDLDAAGGDGAWQGTRKVADWAFYKDDAAARSQWTDAKSGARLMVFAHPQSVLTDAAEFRRDYVAQMGRQGTRTIVDDENVPAPFHGFRYAGDIKTKDGREVLLMSYFLDDAPAHDLHEVRIVVAPTDQEAADALVRDFLQHARFVDAVAPQR